MRVYHNSFFAMGSRFNAVFPFYNQEICEHIFNSIQSEVLRIESRLSYFDSHSEVYKINSSASKSPVSLDDELFGIIDTCINYAALTGGAFDITMRPVIESIKENKGEEANNGYSRMNQIKLDRDNKSVYFAADEVKIDFGAFGKGYALEKAEYILKNSPVENAFISFGESSIWARGKHPGGDYWQVGIKNLFDASESLYVFSLSGSSISTSGNYYTDDSGQLCRKINVINPATGKTAGGLSLMSVKSDSPVEAEILSTAFLVMEDRQIFETMEKFDGVEAVRISYNEETPVKKIFKKV